jgi:hypothetical protein
MAKQVALIFKQLGQRVMWQELQQQKNLNFYIT